MVTHTVFYVYREAFWAVLGLVLLKEAAFGVGCWYSPPSPFFSRYLFSGLPGSIMDVLREQLAKSLTGGQAFVSFKKALDGISVEVCNKKTGKHLHTIYQELEHMRIAQEDLLYYALLDEWESPSFPDGLWPKDGYVATQEEWDKSVKGFFSDLNKAVELVENSEIDLLSLIPRSEYTYLREIIIIVEHNAYHLGKIVDIRKALGDWKS